MGGWFQPIQQLQRLFASLVGWASDGSEESIGPTRRAAVSGRSIDSIDSIDRSCARACVVGWVCVEGKKKKVWKRARSRPSKHVRQQQRQAPDFPIDASTHTDSARAPGRALGRRPSISRPLSRSNQADAVASRRLSQSAKSLTPDDRSRAAAAMDWLGAFLSFFSSFC